MVFVRNIFRARAEKKDFENEPVLDRMELQLKKSGVDTQYVKNVDLSWAKIDISRLIKQYSNGEYILLFPFCSKNFLKKSGHILKN